MIIINLESLAHTIDLLRNTNFSLESIFFNDGVTCNKINKFIIHYEDFDINGTFQTIERKYTIELIKADNLTFWFENGKLKTLPRTISNPKDIANPLPNEISDYMF
ncbi:hypothetical protein [Vibrio splendidus]|uniref:hypothetical protein n=1 Tax=Vibrio splendidus TaxID=29497 RepID=UPI000769A803|nr:hypothetical protein [Vibrio splendidus]